MKKNVILFYFFCHMAVHGPALPGQLAPVYDITHLSGSAEPICQSFDMFGEFFLEAKEISPDAGEIKRKEGDNEKHFPFPS